MLTNLVSNAIKFTERGGVTVSVRPDLAAGWVTISVADTGVGMTPEFVPFVFDEFRQESDGFARRHEGNGLGLAIVRRLALLHGGTVAAESVLGAGSTFTLRLPLGHGPA